MNIVAVLPWAVVLMALSILSCQPGLPASPIAPAATDLPAPSSSAPTPDPAATLHEARLLMLELINEARADVGVPPVELGNNRAAQIHADNLAAACASSHWGLDGTKPEWRYSLAGGYQTNAENVSSLPVCEVRTDSAESQIRLVLAGLMDSSGHRDVILDPLYRRVNLGLATARHGDLYVVQQFEGDYIDYLQLPRIDAGVLNIKGELKGGARIEAPEELELQVWYDPPPRPVTIGQGARTYCVDAGRHVASIRPLPPGRSEIKWKPFQGAHEFCGTPHDWPVDTPAPVSAADAEALWREAKTRWEDSEDVFLTVRWIPANTWRIYGAMFEVIADLSEVVEEYGPGVYSAIVWAPVNGEHAVVSEYSIFHGAEPPSGYEPR